MKKKKVMTVIITFAAMLSARTVALATIIHSNLSGQDLSLADLSGKSYVNVTKPGGENFWIIGAMIVAAMVFMLLDRAKAQKAKKTKETD